MGKEWTLLHFSRSLIGGNLNPKFRSISDREKWSKVHFFPFCSTWPNLFRTLYWIKIHTLGYHTKYANVRFCGALLHVLELPQTLFLLITYQIIAYNNLIISRKIRNSLWTCWTIYFSLIFAIFGRNFEIFY